MRRIPGRWPEPVGLIGIPYQAIAVTGLFPVLEGFKSVPGKRHEHSNATAVRGDRRQPSRWPVGPRRDLLIEHLHLIQDRYGYLSAAHLAALAQEMKLALVEVYEVATFYAHFDVVKEGETPPPAVTVRVC